MNEPLQNGNGPAYFQFKFTPPMLALFLVGLALCAAGFSLNTWQFVIFLQGDLSSPYDWLKFILLYFASVFLAVIIIGMLVKSQYVITDKELIVQFGIIRTRYSLNKIRSVCHIRSMGKLAVYFDDYKTKYVLIAVKEVWYNDFIKALTDRNNRIEITFDDEEKK